MPKAEREGKNNTEKPDVLDALDVNYVSQDLAGSHIPTGSSSTSGCLVVSWGILRVGLMVSWCSNIHWPVGGMGAACLTEFDMLYDPLSDRGICR